VTAHSILIVSHEHPPAPGAGGKRWEAISTYLREQGHAVTIVASDAWGTSPDDRQHGVVRVGDLRSSRLLRGLLRRGKLRLTGDEGLTERPPGALLTKVLVPEISVVLWLPALFFKVRRLIAEKSFDCLITTSPPESAHLVGLLLGRSRPAWIADFRDGWTFEPWRESFPTRFQRGLDAWFERRVVRTAEVAVGATRPIAEDLDARLGANAVWIPNGSHPSLASTANVATPSVRETDAVTLVYTGTLSGEWGRSPEPFFRALRRVVDERPAQAIKLLHAGRLTTEERALVAESGLDTTFTHLGTLDRVEVVKLQRSADVLVLITSRNRSEATSKIFEYLAARRPILALAQDNEAARIIDETNSGITVAPDDVEAIAAALRATANGDLARNFAPKGVERFIYPAPAKQMSKLVTEAIRLKSNL